MDDPAYIAGDLGTDLAKFQLVTLLKCVRHRYGTVEFLYQTQGKQTLLLAEMNHVIHFSQ